MIASCLLGCIVLWSACCDRDSREARRRDLQDRIDRLDARIALIEHRAQAATDALRIRLNEALGELREKSRLTASRVAGLATSTEESFRRFDADATFAVNELDQMVDRETRATTPR